ncbi:MAG: peptidase U32 family protein [Pseudomonadota bacterium]
MELLAPAGSIEAFHAALENGADAVYLGLKSYNARAYAKNFTIKDLQWLLAYSQTKKVKIYIALNSLIRESEIPQLVRLLSALDQIQPEAVIIQDLGIYHLIKSHFPRLTMHGSVLMTVHNSLGAKQLWEMGFKRVVLAREMTLDEIEKIRTACPIELEVFIHGALCYSYSGLCCFSSYLGGRGSTRGRCTQPCRRRYKKAGGRQGYFFSCSDLATIDLLLRFKELGIAGLKIEGRMRSATYVAAITRAYRLALDSPESAIAEAKSYLSESMGRRLTRGFYTGKREDILSPNTLPNIGQFIGSVTGSCKDGVMVKAKESFSVGDRIRAYFPKTDEQASATIIEIKTCGENVKEIEQGKTAFTVLPFACDPGTLLFRVDASSFYQELPAARIWEIIKKAVGKKIPELKPDLPIDIKKVPGNSIQQTASRPQKNEALFVRINTGQSPPDEQGIRINQFIINLSKQHDQRLSRLVASLQKQKKTVWLSLPPIIHEKDIGFYRKAIADMKKKGVVNWEITNIGQLQLVGNSRLFLQAGHQLNLLNSKAFQAIGDLGVASGVISIEADSSDLSALLHKTQNRVRHVVTLYSHPVVFTSRIVPAGLKNGELLESSRQERYRLIIMDNISYLIAARPFSWMEFYEEIKGMGCNAFVLDLTHEHKGRDIIRGFMGKRFPRGGSLFNYKRGLH